MSSTLKGLGLGSVDPYGMNKDQLKKKWQDQERSKKENEKLLKKIQKSLNEEKKYQQKLKKQSSKEKLLLKSGTKRLDQSIESPKLGDSMQSKGLTSVLANSVQQIEQADSDNRTVTDSESSRNASKK